MPSRLKSLEMHGYKTFAARTEFQFAGSITAIVGPNGSGKSNIADAIRWVLGEQSFSLLRGKKTEDMIFSGSELRPRAGMASATIVFDNDDGWLPIDFSEVAITRRAYRDGENEYLLNGQRVRLRDVGELLAKSGLAERTYTIIGQGLVDAALALKAEERRQLFEEAAGIGLYRTRKEEALRRLEATRRNLERVEDILAELQPRLRSLERQARRSQEYEQVKADLRLVLRDWYGYHWHKTQQELTEAHNAAHAQETALESTRQNLADSEKLLFDSRERIQKLRVRLNTWHHQSAQYHNQSETLNRDLAVREERERSLRVQYQDSVTESTLLNEELVLFKERLVSAEEEVTRRKQELTEAQIQVEAAREALLDRQKDREQAEREVEIARQTLSEHTARQAHLKTRLIESNLKAEQFFPAIQAATEAIVTAAKDVQIQQKRLNELTRAMKEAESNRQKAEETAKDHHRRVLEIEMTRKEILEKRAVKETEVARLSAQLEVLEQAENALAGYADGARVLIQAARQSRLSGLRGALSNYLDIPVELEIAVAAALGEYVDGILIETGVSPEEALGYLEGQTTKAALLPVDTLLPVSEGSAIDIQPVEGILGQAVELLTAPEELKPVVDLLLRQVWIAKDRKIARRFIQDMRLMGVGISPNCRVVTLRGEVFYASGQILAGQEGKSGTISRPRQRREIAQSLSESKLQVNQFSEQLQKIDGDLTILRVEGVKADTEVQDRRQQEEEARNADNQQELAVEKARRQHQWQREQKVNLEAEIKRSLEEINQIINELSQLETMVHSANEGLRVKNIDLLSLSLDESQTQVSHWNTRQAVIERALVEASHRQKERQEELERADRNRDGLQSKINEFEVSLKELGTERILLRGEEASLKTQIEKLEALISPADDELQKLEDEQTNLETHVAKTRQELSLAEHRHAQARIALARRQEALDGLRHRIEDDFGLVAFEYTDSVSGPTPLPIQGMVEQLPLIKELSPDIEETIRIQRGQIHRIGPINPEAQAEYEEVKERFEFLTDQLADLHKAEADVKQVIGELDLLMEREFRTTFDAVAQEFRTIFTRLFGGGTARLVLTDPEDLTNTGIDIEARLPGRRTQGLMLLSGGERSLTATSLVFALLKVSPTPFCVLDEVDAMLDEANVGRFRELLRELSDDTQFIIITHNRNTVQVSDVIYGITMGPDSTSQVLSLKLDEVGQVVD